VAAIQLGLSFVPISVGGLSGPPHVLRLPKIPEVVVCWPAAANTYVVGGPRQQAAARSGQQQRRHPNELSGPSQGGRGGPATGPQTGGPSSQSAAPNMPMTLRIFPGFFFIFGFFLFFSPGIFGYFSTFPRISLYNLANCEEPSIFLSCKARL